MTRELGFINLHPGVLGVFVSNEHVGQIRQIENNSPAFVMGKSRKPLDADTLRAIAVKMEVMKNG